MDTQNAPRAQGAVPSGRAAASTEDSTHPAPGRGRWFAGTGRDAVNAVERLVCGDGAVHSPAAGEGLALAGHRAAVLAGRAAAPALATGGDPSRAPFVLHREHTGTAPPVGRFGFELVAATAQEGVDHALAAHRLAERLGVAGLCTLDVGPAAALGLVRLPDHDLVHAVLGEGGPVARDSGDLDAEAIVEEARAALDAVSTATGRPLGALVLEHMGDAEHVLVAAGAEATRALHVVESLRASGVRCGLIRVVLLHPFPRESMARLLAGRRGVVVLDDSHGVDAGLAWLVRGSLGEEQAREVSEVAPSGDGHGDLRPRLGAAFGVQVEPVDRPAAKPGPRVVAGAVPAGPWAEALLLEAGARLGPLGDVTLARPCPTLPGVESLIAARGRRDDQPARCLDVLFVAHPSLLGAAEASTVREGGTVLVLAPPADDERLWWSFDEAARAALADRKVALRRIASTGDGVPRAAREMMLYLAGALLTGAAPFARFGEGTDLAAAADDSDIRTVLARGAGAVADIAVPAAGATPPAAETDFEAGSPLPRLDAPAGDTETSPAWREAVRRFHLGGERVAPASEILPVLPLEPAGLMPLIDRMKSDPPFPMVLSGDPAAGATRFGRRLEELLAELEQAGEPAAMVEEAIAPLTRAAGQAALAGPAPLPLLEAYDKASVAVSARIELSDQARAQLDSEIARVRDRLDDRGHAVGLDRGALPLLYSAALRRRRGAVASAFRAEAEQLLRRMEETLQVDAAQGPEGAAPDVLAATLGDGADAVDPAALARNLPQRRGSRRMDEARRARIEHCVSVLRRHLRTAENGPDFILVHDGTVPPGPSVAGTRTVAHPDPLGAAVGLFDGLAADMVEVARAARCARLEVEGAFDEERHGPALNRLDWQGLDADELLLMTPVTVVESTGGVEGRFLTSLSDLLRSGRPVHVLVAETCASGSEEETREALAGFHRGVGYLAVAHREAFVLQSSLAVPEHLAGGLDRMAAALGPAVALVAVPSWDSTTPPEIQLVAALEGRATPCFLYDPAAGLSWAERFDLEGNPEPERVWPLPSPSCLGSDGTETALEDPFTFAHAAALDPTFRAHFMVIPAEGWSDEQMEIASWLEQEAAGEPPRAVPYLRVVDEAGVIRRAVLTRETAFACRDRMREWRVLQELSGTNNEHVRRAREAARDQAEQAAAAERAELEEAHARQLGEVRLQAASEAMERLARALTDPEGLAFQGMPAAATAPAPAAPAAPAVEASPEVQVEEVEEEEEEVSFDEPYIDAPLCTTCNECTQINGQVFKYDGNKQAYIADASAGTFAQLVKAAEKCPARCIHPGVPRDGDDSVTDDLLARAKKFN